MSRSRVGLIVLSAMFLLSALAPAVSAVEPGATEYYMSYDEVTQELDLIAQEHGDIAALFSIGTTWEDRDIWALKVSDNPFEDEDEPEVLFTGAHHAKEWPGVELMMATIRLLVGSYGVDGRDADGDGFADDDNDRDGVSNEDPFDGEDNDGDGSLDEDWSEARLSWIVDNRQLWFVPVLNPDGLEHCRQQVAGGETDEGALWRKNREPNYSDLGPLQGITYGVDLNRNYGFHWGELGAQTYANSAAEDYIGPVDKHDDDGDRRLNEDPMDNEDNDGDGAVDEDTRGGFSARETRTMEGLVEEHDFVVALHFHTFKGTIYWPWMYTLQLPADEETFKGLAVGMNVFNGYEYRDMSQRNQQTFSRHPPVDGDSNDWMYGKHGVLSFTIELGWNSFIPGEGELAGIVAENLGANLFVMEVADNPELDDVTLAHLPVDRAPADGPLELDVQVSGGELFLGGMRLFYRVDGGEYQEVVMEASSGAGGYSASLYDLDEGDEVEYYFSARSKSQGTAFLPMYGPYETFTVTVGEASSSSVGWGAGFAFLLVILVVLAVVFRRRVLVLVGTARGTARRLLRMKA